MKNKQLQSILNDLESKAITKHQVYDLILNLFNTDWIKASERLPEHFESVLVWGKGYAITECFYCDNPDWGVQGFYKDECGYDGEYPLIRDWVTHWMPFPNKPTV